MIEGEVVWSPDPETVLGTQIDRFRRSLAAEKKLDFADYATLHAYSVDNPEDFWDYCWRFLGIVGDRPTGLDQLDGPLTDEQRKLVMSTRSVEGARFFPSSMINFAENALSALPETQQVISISESMETGIRSMGAEQLRSEVARVADGLRELGVQAGDRVAGYLPNQSETLVAFLATASIGAIWSCCSPDFGVAAVVDRFKQIEPKVVIFVTGYRYANKEIDRREAVSEILRALPSLKVAVAVDYLAGYGFNGWSGIRIFKWSELGSSSAELTFHRVEFSTPLWILFSSGTTGLPKPIVHSHGGATIELTKTLALQHDLGPGRKFFWFTTTGWMMWNYLIGGLLVGADIVLFDGSPGYPDLSTLWRLCSDLEIDTFGISAPYVASCMKAGLDVGTKFSFPKLRAVGSTGAPLALDGFSYLMEQLGSGVQIVSASGGTDVCTAFLSSSPMIPTYAGKLSCATLGSAVESYSPEGHGVIGEVGELVLSRPLPSMPVMFWGDPDGSRLHNAYFADIPGVWRHGDWVRMDPDGSAVIFGRSDSTLNRDGVRMGTAEFYASLESFPEVVDSLVIDTSGLGRQGELIAFLVLGSGSELNEELVHRLRAKIKEELSPRHVPDRFIAVSEIPRTMNGKKLEVPIRKLLLGAELSEVVVSGSLANPEAVLEILKAIKN